MNRELKFRAWDGENMLNIDHWTLSMINQHIPENHIIEQYSGKKDINGVEVYEGDKIKTNKGVIFQVIWSPKSSRWACTTPNVFTDNPRVGKLIYRNLAWLSEKGEVIGHIHLPPPLTQRK